MGMGIKMRESCEKRREGGCIERKDGGEKGTLELYAVLVLQSVLLFNPILRTPHITSVLASRDGLRDETKCQYFELS